MSMKTFIRSEWEPIDKLMWHDWNKIMFDYGYQVPEDIIRECIDIIGLWLIIRTQHISNNFYREFKEEFDNLKERI